MLTGNDVRKIAKRQAARERLSYSTEDLDDVTQDAIVGVLEYLQGKDSVELSEVTRIAETTARKSWKRIKAESPIRLGDSADTLVGYLFPAEVADTEIQHSDRPAWIPGDLWPVARLVASGWNNCEVARELGVNERTVRRSKKRLALLPVPFRQWATAQSENRRKAEAIPDYSRVSSTPIALGDIPPNVDKPDVPLGDDPVDVLDYCWEGLVVGGMMGKAEKQHPELIVTKYGLDAVTCGRRAESEGM